MLAEVVVADVGIAPGRAKDSWGRRGKRGESSMATCPGPYAPTNWRLSREASMHGRGILGLRCFVRSAASRSQDEWISFDSRWSAINTPLIGGNGDPPGYADLGIAVGGKTVVYRRTTACYGGCLTTGRIPEGHLLHLIKTADASPEEKRELQSKIESGSMRAREDALNRLDQLLPGCRARLLRLWTAYGRSSVYLWRTAVLLPHQTSTVRALVARADRSAGAPGQRNLDFARRV